VIIISLNDLKSKLNKYMSERFIIKVIIITHKESELNILEKLKSGEIKSYKFKNGDILTTNLLNSYRTIICIIDPMEGRGRNKKQ
jgi:hypothetical protein